MYDIYSEVDPSMILRRKIYSKLKEWKAETKGRKSILIEGARRIGKSTIAEEFGKNEYSSYIVIDFAKKDLLVEEYFNSYVNYSAIELPEHRGV